MNSWQAAWHQTTTPVVVRRRRDSLRIRLPYDPANRKFLRNGRRSEPRWVRDKGWWEIPRAWFNDFIDRALEHYGRVYVIQPYTQEKCAPACLNAQGHICECSCMGANHGMGNDGTWFEVSETFAFRWSDTDLACRLLVRRAI